MLAQLELIHLTKIYKALINVLFVTLDTLDQLLLWLQKEIDVVLGTFELEGLLALNRNLLIYQA